MAGREKKKRRQRAHRPRSASHAVAGVPLWSEPALWPFAPTLPLIGMLVTTYLVLAIGPATLTEPVAAEPPARTVTVPAEQAERVPSAVAAVAGPAIAADTTVWFASGHTTLAADQRRELREFAARASAEGASLVRVAGHADNTGPDEVNRTVSMERARTVESLLRDALTRTDVTFEVSAHGSDQPAGGPGAPRDRAADRRVEVVAETW
ncbi:OmpA family protein [Marinactinospora thermotolerans]|uniref:OmpA family protein n=1 Tax=Marinactinospora thermotolerans TaxID=531310 RepID=UPI003D94A6AF